MPEPWMPDAARPSRLELRVRDAGHVGRFYRDALGLAPLDRRGHHLAPGDRGLELVLDEAPEAGVRPPRAAGLFHAALRVPDRAALGALVARLRGLEVPLAGAADHGVSEAIYLTDPEGNGLEVYRDRPRQAWPTRGEEVAMGTEPLDVDALVEAADGPAALPPDTDIGHVHLRVPALEPARAFYEALGLRVRQSTYPGALFLAAGDYHHHVGLNTWGGVREPAEDAPGLSSYAWTLPEGAWADWRASTGVEPVEEGEGWLAAVDPAGVRVRVHAHGTDAGAGRKA